MYKDTKARLLNPLLFKVLKEGVGVASRVYFVRMRAGDFVETQQVGLLR